MAKNNKHKRNKHKQKGPSDNAVVVLCHPFRDCCCPAAEAKHGDDVGFHVEQGDYPNEYTIGEFSPPDWVFELAIARNTDGSYWYWDNGRSTDGRWVRFVKGGA